MSSAVNSPSHVQATPAGGAIAMTAGKHKVKVLVFVRNYLPGYKAGGVLRTIANTVEWLGDEVEFWIVTRDRDLGSKTPYADVPTRQWLPMHGVMMHYLAPRDITMAKVAALISATPHDLIHLNSYFDPVFSLRIMLARKLGALAKTPLLLSPRGEFGDGSLKLKYPKKWIFIRLARVIGLFADVRWHASSKFELQDIVNVVKPNQARLTVALDLPAKVMPASPVQAAAAAASALKVVFLSRIAREKNLEFALQVLGRVDSQVVFDVYGPAEDAVYWKECQKLLPGMPANIVVSYRGPVAPEDVPAIFAAYDLFFLPTKGENYGHVIAEAISVGTQVLISKDTPWRDLESDGVGWDVDLQSMPTFVNIIEALARQSASERLAHRAVVRLGALQRLFDPIVLQDNINLFRI